MRRIAPVLTILAASPALAAGDKPFFSLANTDFVVLIGFVIFIGVLVYFGVPKMITDMLDKRATDIQAELDEAKALRDEAQTLLASYERKQREVAQQADAIVAQAKEEAEMAAEQAKADLAKSVERRLQAAEEKIASAEASALKSVKDQAVAVAVAAAGDVLAKQTDADASSKLIDDAIKTVQSRLH